MVRAVRNEQRAYERGHPAAAEIRPARDGVSVPVRAQVSRAAVSAESRGGTRATATEPREAQVSEVEREDDDERGNDADLDDEGLVDDGHGNSIDPGPDE
jgi:hypothetical protein